MAMCNIGFFIKEIKEQFKTPKFIILFSIFLFFGILSPLVARYMGEIFSLISSDIQIGFPEPTFRNAWTEYYKNISTLCLIVFLIIMTGSVAQEKSKGSIMLVLTKRISRFNFLFSKFAAGVFLYTICLIGSLLVSMIYTQLLFNEFYYSGLALSIFLVWLIGVFYTAFAIFTSIIAKSSTTAALYGFAGYALFNLINIIQGIESYNPAGIPGVINSLLIQSSKTINNVFSVSTAIIFTAAIFITGLFIFKKQEI